MATEGGLSAAVVAQRFGFDPDGGYGEGYSPTSRSKLSSSPHVTRRMRRSTAQALRAGKAVLVEKPLALDEEGLHEVEEALASGRLLMVGFNRRFAPLTIRLREELSASPPPTLLARVNAGPLADDHWLNDPEEGGRKASRRRLPLRRPPGPPGGFPSRTRQRRRDTPAGKAARVQ